METIKTTSPIEHLRIPELNVRKIVSRLWRFLCDLFLL